MSPLRHRKCIVGEALQPDIGSPHEKLRCRYLRFGTGKRLMPYPRIDNQQIPFLYRADTVLKPVFSFSGKNKSQFQMVMPVKVFLILVFPSGSLPGKKKGGIHVFYMNVQPAFFH